MRNKSYPKLKIISFESPSNYICLLIIIDLLEKSLLMNKKLVKERSQKSTKENFKENFFI